MLPVLRAVYWAGAAWRSLEAADNGGGITLGHGWSRGQTRSDHWSFRPDHRLAFGVVQSFVFSRRMACSDDWAVTGEYNVANLLESLLAMARAEEDDLTYEPYEEELVTREVVENQQTNRLERILVYRGTHGALQVELDWNSSCLQYVDGRYDNIAFSEVAIRKIQRAINHYISSERNDWGTEPLEAEDIREFSRIMPRRWRPLAGRLVFYEEWKEIFDEASGDAMATYITAVTVAPPDVQVVCLMRNTVTMPSADVFDLKIDWLDEWIGYWDDLRRRCEHALKIDNKAAGKASKNRGPLDERLD